MEKRETKRPEVYYIKEVENDKGELEIVVDDKPETGEVYLSREVIGQDGRLHIIFWKKSNRTKFV